jgi:hypothetical protein
MLSFDVQIRSPFKSKPFKNYWDKTWSLSKNKAFEMQLSRYAYNLFELGVSLNFTGEDHAGPKFELGIFGYNIAVKLYDKRHWLYDTNTWETYDNTDSKTDS